MTQWRKPEIQEFSVSEIVKLIKAKAESIPKIKLPPESIEVLKNAAVGEEIFVFDVEGNGLRIIKEVVDLLLNIIVLTVIGIGNMVWNCQTNSFQMD